MKVVLYTVPGTGTRFMVRILESVYGYRSVEYPRFRDSGEGDIYTRLHAAPEDQKHALIGNLDGRFVTPLRDPVMSFLSRYAVTVDNAAPTWTVADSACRWARLMGEVEKHRIFCFDVETDGYQNRRVLMKGLEAHIEPRKVNSEALEKLLLEWSPVGASEISPEKVEYLETGWVKRFDLRPLAPAMAWVESFWGGGKFFGASL